MNRRFSFNPTISFDGVAIIIAVIALAVWAGQIKEQVSQTAAQVRSHDEQLFKLNQTTASLAAIISERERK